MGRGSRWARLAAGTMEESSYYRTIAKDGVDEARLNAPPSMRTLNAT